MPNETLLQQLEFLRDNYNRQHKTASVLETSLKTVTNVQSRVQKALSDYSQQNSGTDVSNVQATLANARLKEDVVDPLLPDLRRELKSLAVIISALKDALAALNSEPVDVVRLDKAISHLQTTRTQEITDVLPELNRELELAQLALSNEFGAKLRDELAELGISIGGRGPTFQIGRFELEANFAKRFTTLRYGKDVVVPHTSITIEAVLKAYQSAAKAIAGRSLEGKTWIAQFYEAYQRVRCKLGVDDIRINIVECYVEMVILRQGRAFSSEPSKRTFTDYSRAQFIYDFYEYANHQRVAYNGYVVRAHSATKSQADNATKSMWIVEGDTPYDGRYIADVEFEKE